MAKNPSRREILGAAAVGVAAMATPMAMANITPQALTTEMLEKELAKPLSPEAKKILAESLKGIEASAKERLKTKLPENSEPCFSYIPSTREVRAK